MYYVYCPYGFKTGGTELLHQFALEIKQLHHDVSIVYDVDTLPDHLTEGFEEYDVPFTCRSRVQDNLNDVVIFPEIYVRGIKKYFPRARRVCWWLSVDNYLFRENLQGYVKIHGHKPLTIARGIKQVLLGKIYFTHRNFLPNFSDYHLCQSEYAYNFLVERGVPATDIQMLSDYLNDSFFTTPPDLHSSAREPAVIFNPVKGFEQTQQLIKAFPKIKWIPIQNMTTEQVHQLMQRSMVYIDFGNHPGKDRMPREAAISGNCVITNRCGSANFSKDVPIPDEFKFANLQSSLSSVGSLITNILSDYDSYIEQFREYRDMISGEKSSFHHDTLRFISHYSGK